GVPRYDDFDELDLLGLGGDGRLVRDPAVTGRYWVEGQGHMVRVDRLANHFEVYDGTGNHYFLGVDSEGIEGVDGKTLRRHVQCSQNRLGKRIRVHYRHDGTQISLSGVTWGPNEPFALDVTLDQRPDVTTSWRSGYEVKTALRISTVTVRAFSEVARVYDLSYDDDTFPVSRLERVHMRGRGGQNALPDLSFTYVKSEPAQLGELGHVGG